MEDAPKRIWATGKAGFCSRWNDHLEQGYHSHVKYIRADLHADLLRAADALADKSSELRRAQRAYLASKDNTDDRDTLQSRGAHVGRCAVLLDDALSAYNKAKEKTK